MLELIKDSVILFQGDSITDSWRAREDDNHAGTGYPGLIKSYLLYEHPELKLKIYNKGISGHRIVDLFARWKEDTINLKPNIVSMLIGVNDVWHELEWNRGVSIEKFVKVYEMLIDETRELLPGVEFVILEPFMLPGTATNEKLDIWKENIAIWQKEVKNIVDKKKCHFVPLQECFNEHAKINGPDYWLFDGVHPTEAGHELIKNEWLKVFSK